MADEHPEGPEGGKPSGWSADLGTVGEYLQLAFVFPLTLVVGFFLGRWLGTLLGAPTAGAIAGLALGTAAAFYNLFQTLRRLERREAARGRERED